MMPLKVEPEAIPLTKEDILIVEDDSSHVDALVTELVRQQYTVRVAIDDHTGLAALEKKAPGMVILGPVSPDSHSWELCRFIKNRPGTRSVLVLFLTELNGEENRLRGFHLGADEYLTKPYSIRELTARIRALFRRAKMKRQKNTRGHLQLGRLFIDVENHDVRVDGSVQQLTHTEFALLKYLAEHPGRVFSRNQLIDVLWGEDRFVECRNVDVHIYSLRKRIEPNPACPTFLLTVRSIGYKFTPG